jgi:cytoskeletal protein RodZ
MAKILWLVLLCAPFGVALFVVWTSIINASTPPPASPTTSQADAAAPIMEEDDRPLAKADRLPLSGSPSPSSDADIANLATIEPERPDRPPPTISRASPLTSKPAATSSTRPPARRHATRSPTVRRRSQPERLQQAPSPGGPIDQTNGVTSWHWHAGSTAVERR